jgi:PAS domain S-box-containing protein
MPVEIHARILELRDRKLILSAARDITERKQAEAALRASEEKLQSIFRAAPVGIGMVVNRVFSEVNQWFCDLTGYGREELIGQSARLVYPSEEEYERVGREKYAQFALSVTGEVETQFRRKDGTVRNVLLRSSPRDPADLSVGVIFTALDITERKRAEETLQESEEKYRLLVNQIPAVVYIGYPDWSLDCFDRKIEELTGYAKEDFDSRRRTWLDLVFPEDIDKAKKRFRAAVKGDGSYVTEHRIRNKTGEVSWIQARNRIILDAAGKVEYISGVFFDITERKKMEDQLSKAQKMEVVGLLAGGVAHDFNNLLTAIMGYSDMIMMRLRQEDPLYPYVQEISKAAARGASLTHQLLAFSRKQILQPQVVNLNEVVLGMENMLRRLIGEDIDLLTSIDQELGFVKADPGQIEQIIMNLAVNAREAMPHGGNLTIETANVSLDQSYTRGHIDVSPGPYVMLAMSDNGLGMDAGTISHIFEPFFTTKETGKGTGLGLATVYGIVKQSGGHIWVYSEPGQGTTFKIYLPRVEELPEEAKPKAAAPAFLGGNETILVVEDDAVLRELISTALRTYGFTVMEAEHGGEALLICEREQAPIHLMLTDVVMPQMSGSALAERLKQLHPEMKIIFMSGYTENAIVHHGVLYAQVNFIPKPFKMLALMQKIREVLDTT